MVRNRRKLNTDLLVKYHTHNLGASWCQRDKLFRLDPKLHGSK